MASDQPTPAPKDEAADSGPTAAESTDEGAGEDDTRRRFREALARKQERGHLGGNSTSATQHPHAAPAKRGRTFRRKSG